MILNSPLPPRFFYSTLFSWTEGNGSSNKAFDRENNRLVVKLQPNLFNQSKWINSFNRNELFHWNKHSLPVRGRERIQYSAGRERERVEDAQRGHRVGNKSEECWSHVGIQWRRYSVRKMTKIFIPQNDAIIRVVVLAHGSSNVIPSCPILCDLATYSLF